MARKSGDHLLGVLQQDLELALLAAAAMNAAASGLTVMGICAVVAMLPPQTS
jgi:hypothetical protein